MITLALITLCSFMRKLVTYIIIVIVALFTACNKTTVYELDYAYNKRLITSEVRHAVIRLTNNHGNLLLVVVYKL